jgi:hypothetical protein
MVQSTFCNYFEHIFVAECGLSGRFDRLKKHLRKLKIFVYSAIKFMKIISSEAETLGFFPNFIRNNQNKSIRDDTLFMFKCAKVNFTKFLTVPVIRIFKNAEII